MCEVQGVGAAPGRTKGASPPPERLSVSSSEDEEDQKPPRHSLLSQSEEVLKEEPLEGTSNSRDEPGEDEASKLPVVTPNNKVVEEEEEEEVDVEKLDDETEEKLKKENMEENNEQEEKEDSDSETKKVRVSVCDENEKENQENERRDEILENTVKIEREIKEEKIVLGSAEEENRRGNDEEASASDSPMEDEPRKQEEEEEKAEEEEEEKEGKESQHKQDDVKKPKEEVTEMEENEKEKIKEEKEEKKKEEEEEGIDPFSPKSPKEAPTTHKVSKTVNFLETELKISNDYKRHTINSFSSSSSSYKVTKEGETKEGVEEDEKASRSWTIGEGNPVYRLSMKLSPSLFNTTDIPGANQHKEAEKAGFLTKLSGRSFPYIAQWKSRYCVLSKGRLYYYEREDSKAGDKSNGVIQLEYFDQVAEAGPKECKKATNVFIITSQDRSFFDPGRHVFSASTLPDMKDWIRKLQAALDQIRNNNRPAASTSPSASPSAKEGGGKRRRDETAESKEGKGNQAQPTTTTTTTAKDRRKKKEEPSRPRKSSRVGVSSQTQTLMVEPMTCKPDGGRPVSAIPKGGVMLPGFSSRNDPQMTTKLEERRSGEGEAENLLQGGPTLLCVTKMRVKGPQGRRAPQNRRQTAAALKKRASSLSALEHQDANDNRSENSEGATRSSRDSQTPEVDLNEKSKNEEEIRKKKIKNEAIVEVEENSPERQFTFDNIDDGLFFKAGLKDLSVEGNGGLEGNGQGRSSGLKVNFEESPTTPPSKNGTLGRFLRLKDSLVPPKRNKFVAKEGLTADHPDMMSNSRWSCVIL